MSASVVSRIKARTQLALQCTRRERGHPRGPGARSRIRAVQQDDCSAQVCLTTRVNERVERFSSICRALACTLLGCAALRCRRVCPPARPRPHTAAQIPYQRRTTERRCPSWGRRVSGGAGSCGDVRDEGADGQSSQEGVEVGLAVEAAKVDADTVCGGLHTD